MELNSLIRRLQSEKKITYGLVAPPIPQKLLYDCRVFTDRYELIKSLPLDRPVVAEVGTMSGGFASFLIDALKPKSIEILDVSFKFFEQRFIDGKDNLVVNLVEGDSSTMMSLYPDNYFDLIYLDANHTPEGVAKDLHIIPRKIKPGGYLVANDYIAYSIHDTCEYGVPFHFNQLVSAEGWHVTHLALHSRGYFDVAAQKPTL